MNSPWFFLIHPESRPPGRKALSLPSCSLPRAAWSSESSDRQGSAVRGKVPRSQICWGQIVGKTGWCGQCSMGQPKICNEHVIGLASGKIADTDGFYHEIHGGSCKCSLKPSHWFWKNLGKHREIWGDAVGYCGICNWYGLYIYICIIYSINIWGFINVKKSGKMVG